MENTITVHVKCAISSTSVVVTVDRHQQVKKIKEILRDEHGFRTDLTVLKLNGRHMMDSYKLSEVLFDKCATLQLELIPPLAKSFPSYDNFCRSISFTDSLGVECTPRRVAVNCSITLKFPPAVDLNYFTDKNRLDNELKSNHMVEVFGVRWAKERGFVQWTNFTTSDKLLLVEVSDPLLESRTDSVRYKWDGVNGFYVGGDVHSWQRYTKKIPLPIRINAIDDGRISVCPQEPLQHNQLYALLLLHGVPTVTRDGIVENRIDNVPEDKLMIFCTCSADSRNAVTNVERSHSSAAVPLADDTDWAGRQVELQIQPYYRVERFVADMVVVPTTTLLDLKNVVGSCIGLPNKDIILSINGEISTSELDLVLSFKLKARNLVHVLPAFSSTPSHLIADYAALSNPAVSSYEPYIRATFPINGKVDVSVSVAISVQFQSVRHVSRVGGFYSTLLERDESLISNMVSSHSSDDYSRPFLCGRHLLLDCFKDFSLRVVAGASHPMRCQDMTNALGTNQAAKRGYVCWTRASDCHNDAPSHHRIYLLEVHENLAARWNDVAYKFGLCDGVNGSYCGGDADSWQRYTRRPPVRGVIYIDNTTNSVTFKPSQLLKSGTTYGVLLANGVPSVSDAGGRTPDAAEETREDWFSIQQDYIFFFTTAGAAPRCAADDEEYALSHNLYRSDGSTKRTRISSMADENLAGEEEPMVSADACAIS